MTYAIVYLDTEFGAGWYVELSDGHVFGPFGTAEAAESFARRETL